MIELERPGRVVEHSPGLTHSLDCGKEGLAVNATRGKRTNTIEAFWAQVEVGDCWLWNGGLTPEGYGYYWFDGTTRPAHRIAYTHLVGEIPPGFHLDHLCRVRNCVNPDHLEAVTPELNNLRGNAHRMNARSCPHGHDRTPEDTLPVNNSRRCRQCVLVYTHRKRGVACDHDAFCSAQSHSSRRAKVTEENP